MPLVFCRFGDNGRLILCFISFQKENFTHFIPLLSLYCSLQLFFPSSVHNHVFLTYFLTFPSWFLSGALFTFQEILLLPSILHSFLVKFLVLFVFFCLFLLLNTSFFFPFLSICLPVLDFILLPFLFSLHVPFLNIFIYNPTCTVISAAACPSTS